jgi:hypothetical protein
VIFTIFGKSIVSQTGRARKTEFLEKPPLPPQCIYQKTCGIPKIRTFSVFLFRSKVFEEGFG